MHDPAALYAARKRLTQLALLVLVASLSMLGCTERGTNSQPSAGAATEQPPLPAVTPDQAEQALTDAMLVSAVSLLLALGVEEGESSASSEDQRLTLSWSDDADFATGIGTYTVTMSEYAVPAKDLFASEYHGYILSGTVTLGSDDGIHQQMTFDLQTSHPDSAAYPVQSIDVTISGGTADGGEAPTGRVLINGHEMDLRDLGAAFELSG